MDSASKVMVDAIKALVNQLLEIARTSYSDSAEVGMESERLRRVMQAFEGPEEQDPQTQAVKQQFADTLNGGHIVAAEVGDDGRIRLAIGRQGERSAFLVALDSDPSSFGKVEVAGGDVVSVVRGEN